MAIGGQDDVTIRARLGFARVSNEGRGLARLHLGGRRSYREEEGKGGREETAGLDQHGADPGVCEEGDELESPLRGRGPEARDEDLGSEVGSWRALLLLECVGWANAHGEQLGGESLVEV